MGTLDVRPDLVELWGYGGDDLDVKITAPSSLVSGATWKAQVRSDAQSTTVGAEFAVTPPAVADGPAYLHLSGAQTRALADAGTLVSVRVGAASYPVQRYSGWWDVQVTFPSGSVKTLSRGPLVVDMDVTR